MKAKWMGDKGLLLYELGGFTTNISFNADNVILRHDNVAGKVIIKPGDYIENVNGRLIRVDG